MKKPDFVSKSEFARLVNQPITALNRLERDGLLVPDLVRPKLKLIAIARVPRIAAQLKG